VAGNLSQPEVDSPTAASLEQQLAVMERGVAPRPPSWSWVLVGVGLLLAVGLSAHALSAYAAIDRINQNANIPTGNVVLLFQELATNGPRVPSSVDSSSRGAYSQAVVQYVLDGTGVCIGLALAFAGLFIRVNG
jgi:hypothetical protein